MRARAWGKEASQTREYCVAKNATHRAARPGPSPSKKRLSQDDKPFGGLEITVHEPKPPLLAKDARNGTPSGVEL
jgi:hypothetical protein